MMKFKSAFLAALFSVSTFAMTANAALVSGSPVTLKLSNGFVAIATTGVSAASTSSTGNSVWTFGDTAHASAPTNGDLITLKGANGRFLVVASNGSVTATGTAGSAFKMLKVRSTVSPTLAVLDGDQIFLQFNGKTCGPSATGSSALFVCTAAYPTASQTLTIKVAPPPVPVGKQAARVSNVLDRFGMNTHFDFLLYEGFGAQRVIDALNYIGNGHLKILRDSPAEDKDITLWAQVATATGAKFNAFIGEEGPDVYRAHSQRMQRMIDSGGNYLFALEGGNEEDAPHAIALGNDQYQAANFQPTLHSIAKAAGLPSVNISFGAGWDKPTGNYGTVGDLSAYADYANAHTYPGAAPESGNYFSRLNGFAKLAASSRPVMISEYGWKTYPDGQPTAGWGIVSRKTQAAYVIEAIFDAYLLGNPYYYYYALIDDGSGTFGLYDKNLVAKPSAIALHNMYTVLSDTGAANRTFAVGALDYTVTGLPAVVSGRGGKQLLLQKSDGSFWLVLFNEQNLNDPTRNNVDVVVPAVTATLALKAAAKSIVVYDPLIGTTPVKSATGVTSLPISVPAHPIFVKIVM
jgi:hypothetical protein